MPHPRGRSLSQFRVVLGVPCSGGFPQHFALAAELDLALGQLGQERTPAPLADKLIYLVNNINRQDDMRSSAETLGHTSSVT